MNSPNRNEFTKLVEYLESQVIVKPEGVSDVKEDKPKDIKKIIEECTTDGKSFEEFKNIQSDSPFPPRHPVSKGFDVERFEALMKMKLVDEYKKLQSYERPYISVTELFSCLRKSYYIRLKYPVDLNKLYSFPYLYLINMVGNEIHDIVQSLYDFTDTEKTIVSERFKVKGRLDAIKENCLVEIKTIDVEKFQNTYRKIDYWQGSVYAYILNTEYSTSIDTITIVYFLRNLKEVVPFDLPFDANLALKFLSYGPVLHSKVSQKSVPDPVNADSEQCKYCLYRKFCLEDETSLVRPFQRKDSDSKKSAFLL